MISNGLPKGRGGVTAVKPRKEPKPKRSTTKNLECVRCSKRYSVNDVLAGNYQLETMVCSYCYREMQSAPHAISCFGKPGYKILPGQCRLYGYNPAATECTSICPDRSLCRIAVAGPNTGGDIVKP